VVVGSHPPLAGDSPAVTDPAVGDALARAVLGFADRLRRMGVDLPTSGVLDAMAALSQVDLASRAETKVALAATLVKRAEDLPAFETMFDRWFALRPPAVAGTGAGGAGAEASSARDARDAGRATLDEVVHEPDGAAEAAAIRDQLAQALATGDLAALPSLAARAVRRWAGIDTVAGSDRYHLQRLLRGLDLSVAAQEALRRERGGSERRPALEERLARADIEALLDRFRRLVADEVRARLADDSRRRPGAGDHDRPSPSRLDDVDFLRASTQELRQMRATIRPLARRLAAKVAQRQRHFRTGRLDMRRTLRASLESGGVPLRPAYRHRPRTRPELWMLCDVSGSVAEFSRFTLAFVYAMHEEFSGLRTFVFVDDVDEITDMLDRRLHDVDPFALLVRASASAATTGGCSAASSTCTARS
jgi:uncharacterized protein with von Willebrand factor type A (vWA) domain